MESGVGIIIVVIVLGLFPVICLYAGQKWAYKSYWELVRLNEKMDELLSQGRYPPK